MVSAVPDTTVSASLNTFQEIFSLERADWNELVWICPAFRLKKNTIYSLNTESKTDKEIPYLPD